VLGEAVRVDEVVTEVGSGVNGRRPQLIRLLGDSEVRMVVVGHGRRVVVVESLAIQRVIWCTTWSRY
jgi:predicted site-specific integrase-resolvase